MNEIQRLTKQVADLTEVLQSNLELIQMLSQRVEMLEKPVKEDAARQMAVMTLLRAVVQCSTNREQIVSMTQRMTAQMSVQPGILVGGGKDTLQSMKTHLDWMTNLPQADQGE